ncbi:MAG TPA: TadE/TadG family type IV pilus assembly protein [Bdellovibrionota bacterium]|nr:TadE/TadG family type IV pilus assembly protein [Bdellovibrionota bacterium]
MKQRKNIAKDEEGQSTVEFLLMFTVVFFFIFMFFQGAITYMTTQYIKYAAFMGARTYAVSADKQLGENVLRSYLGDNGAKLKPWVKDLSWHEIQNGENVGFEIEYKSLFYFPLLGEGRSIAGVTQAAKSNEWLPLKVRSVMKHDFYHCRPGEAFDNKTDPDNGC